MNHLTDGDLYQNEENFVAELTNQPELCAFWVAGICYSPAGNVLYFAREVSANLSEIK